VRRGNPREHEVERRTAEQQQQRHGQRGPRVPAPPEGDRKTCDHGGDGERDHVALGIVANGGHTQELAVDGDGRGRDDETECDQPAGAHPTHIEIMMRSKASA
jgi:hypothetical protein